MNEYTVDHFITKFEATKEEEWCVGQYENADGQHCARGFCGGHPGYKRTDEEKALIDMFYSIGFPVALINDNCEPRYPQPTPRQRILAALHDIKKMEEEK